jgi:hypothetical protein
MELDDFRTVNKLSVNGCKTINDENMEKLFIKVRENFAKRKKTAIIVAGFNLLLSILYAGLLNKDDMVYNLGLTLLCAGLLTGSLYAFFKSRRLNFSAYSLPLLSFLRQTEKNLAFMPPYDWLVVIPALALLGTGGGFVLVDRLLRYTSNTELLIVIWVVFFIALIIFSFTVSRKDWEKENGQLLDEVRRTRISLSENAE